MCGHGYLSRSSQKHLIKFGIDAAIDDFDLGFNIKHAQVVLVLETLDLKGRNALCHRYVLKINQIVKP